MEKFSLSEEAYQEYHSRTSSIEGMLIIIYHALQFILPVKKPMVIKDPAVVLREAWLVIVKASQ